MVSSGLSHVTLPFTPQLLYRLHIVVRLGDSVQGNPRSKGRPKKGKRPRISDDHHNHHNHNELALHTEKDMHHSHVAFLDRKRGKRSRISRRW